MELDPKYVDERKQLYNIPTKIQIYYLDCGEPEVGQGLLDCCSSTIGVATVLEKGPEDFVIVRSFVDNVDEDKFRSILRYEVDNEMEPGLRWDSEYPELGYKGQLIDNVPIRLRYDLLNLYEDTVSFSPRSLFIGDITTIEAEINNGYVDNGSYVTPTKHNAYRKRLVPIEGFEHIFPNKTVLMLFDFGSDLSSLLFRCRGNINTEYWWFSRINNKLKLVPVSESSASNIRKIDNHSTDLDIALKQREAKLAGDSVKRVRDLVPGGLYCHKDLYDTETLDYKDADGIGYFIYLGKFQKEVAVVGKGDFVIDSIPKMNNAWLGSIIRPNQHLIYLVNQKDLIPFGQSIDEFLEFMIFSCNKSDIKEQEFIYRKLTLVDSQKFTRKELSQTYYIDRVLNIPKCTPEEAGDLIKEKCVKYLECLDWDNLGKFFIKSILISLSISELPAMYVMCELYKTLMFFCYEFRSYCSRLKSKDDFDDAKVKKMIFPTPSKATLNIIYNRLTSSEKKRLYKSKILPEITSLIKEGELKIGRR